MLFALPTPVTGTDCPAAPTAGDSPVPGLGVFFPWMRAFGTELESTTHTAVRTGFHGWFAVRRPVVFQAGRKEAIGTALLSLINPRVRTGFHGWFAVRAAEALLHRRTKVLGTAPSSGHETVVRTGFHGWFAVRRPVNFQAGRKEAIGTALLSLINPRVRTSFHGWFVVRAAESALHRRTRAIGTASPSGHETVVRTGFHGWFAVRRPVVFMEREGESTSRYHTSVLPAETAEWMQAGEGKFIIDGTLGGGGHSEAFLASGARVLGIDRDPEALAHARHRLAGYGDRFRTWQGNFANLRDNPEVQGDERADGLLLDLGVSSRQLDALERGFSFRGEGPLDMRMGPDAEMTAADVVNEWSEEELAKVIRELGEDPAARRIAAAIVKARRERPFQSTADLAGCIERAIGRRGRIHPATQTFQAIRMVVNDELGSLERALESSVDLLKPGGRLLVITFHSLEDRMVKRFMQDRSRQWLDRPEWPEPRPNPRWAFRLPRRKAIAPSDQEIRVNPRARSAKLRVAELLDPAVSQS